MIGILLTLYVMVAIAGYAWLISEWMDDKSARKPALGATLFWGALLAAYWPIPVVYIYVVRWRDGRP